MPDVEEKIITELQAGLAITDSPFNDLAEKLGIEKAILFEAANRLVKAGVIREISPVFNARKIGYSSTLVAVSVSDMVVPDLVKRINSFAGVSHNYARQHKFNIWFTLTVPNSIAGADPFEPVLSSLKDDFPIDEIMSLPSRKMYKLKVQFGKKSASGDLPHSSFDLHSLSAVSEPLIVSEEQKQMIRELQKGIPIVERPYEAIAKAANSALGEDSFDSGTIVDLLNSWKRQGAIRRIAGRVRHKKVGYLANAMVVFRVEPADIDNAGAALAEMPCVSHCYHRSTNDLWHYNLYAMTHAKTETELKKAIGKMIDLIKPQKYEQLYTLMEYKKESVKYFV